MQTKIQREGTWKQIGLILLKTKCQLVIAYFQPISKVSLLIRTCSVKKNFFLVKIQTLLSLSSPGRGSMESKYYSLWNKE